MQYDAIEKAREIATTVVKDDQRKYYRVPRPGRWYGGIATADCCGCNLKCVFCWSNKPRDNPGKVGDYYSPDDVFNKIIRCARDHDYRLLRISGNEPTIAQEHLLKVLSLVDTTKYHFILETNGTLLNEAYVQALARFNNLHVRVSLKGTNPDEFSMLTGAAPGAFEKIIEGITFLTEYKIDFSCAAMLSFSPDKNVLLFKERLKGIARSASENLEEEYVFLYPHVVQRLKRAGIKPVIAYTPQGIPRELI